MAFQPGKTALIARLLLIALFIPVASCHKSEKPSVRTFANPDDAGNAVIEAVKAGDQNALLAIFGPESKDLISSGDPVQDKNTGAAFVQWYNVMHRWRKMPDGSQDAYRGSGQFSIPDPAEEKQ